MIELHVFSMTSNMQSHFKEILGCNAMSLFKYMTVSRTCREERGKKKELFTR